jgi:hypothetical protein
MSARLVFLIAVGVSGGVREPGSLSNRLVASSSAGVACRTDAVGESPGSCRQLLQMLWRKV